MSMHDSGLGSPERTFHIVQAQGLSSFRAAANAVIGWLCVMVGLVVFWVFLAPWLWSGLRWLAYRL